MHQAFLSFNAGEVTPYIRHRIDFEKNTAAAEELRNFIAMPYGGAIKRPGLLHLATTTTTTENSRALPFTASDGTHYVLHFVPGTLTIYALDGTVKDTLDFLTGYEWPAGDPSADLRALQMVQLNDVAFLAHPGFHPMRLSRAGDTSWTLEWLPFDTPPALDENTDQTAIITLGPAATPPTVLWWSEYNYNPLPTFLVGDVVKWNQADDGTVTSSPAILFECIVEHVWNYDVKRPYFGSEWTTYWKILDIPPQGDVLLDGDFTNWPEADAGIKGPGSLLVLNIQRAPELWQMELGCYEGAVSQALPVYGGWDLATYGTWDGTFYLDRSPDGTTWTAIRSWESNGDRNIAASGEEYPAAFLRLRYFPQSFPQTSVTPRAVLAPVNQWVPVTVRITEKIDDTQLAAETVGDAPIMYGSTWRWARGAFDDTRGYPRAIALHDGRLWFAGTTANPVSLWASQADDFLNFRTGLDDSDAIFATLAVTSASPIRWLASQRRLFVGTLRGEWMVGADNQNAPITPTGFMARQYSAYGSMPAQPLIANDAVFFAERSGTRLRELGYDAARESYDAADLSRIAEHLTAPGIASFAWQQTREPGLWIVRADGALLHFAYSRAERVAAFSRHDSGTGVFRSVLVFPADDGDDHVFFIITRGNATYLARFPAGWQKAAEAQTGYHHRDGITGTAAGSITLPAYLIGTPVWSTIGGVTTLTTYNASPVTATGAYSIGLPIVSRLVSLPIDTAARDGTTLGRMKRTSRLSLSVLHSAGGQIWNLAESRAQDIPTVTAATTPVSGWFDIIPDAGHLEDLQLRLSHTAPHPFILRAAVMRWVLTGA